MVVVVLRTSACLYIVGKQACLIFYSMLTIFRLDEGRGVQPAVNLSLCRKGAWVVGDIGNHMEIIWDYIGS